MGRFILIQLLLFLTPTILFLLYVKIFHKKKVIEALDLKVVTILAIFGSIGLGIGAMTLSSQSRHELGKSYFPATADQPEPRLE